MKHLLIFGLLFSSSLFAQGNLNPPFQHYASIGQISGYENIERFGCNPDVDISTAPEDLTPIGGNIVQPTSAQTITVASSDAGDSSAGAGCREIFVQGLDSTYAEISETFTPDGTNDVALANQYLRLDVAYCNQSGTSQTNTGNIDFEYGADVKLLRMATGEGATSQMIYTVPLGRKVLIDNVICSLQKMQPDSYVIIEVQTRHPSNNTWITFVNFGLDSNGSSSFNSGNAGPRPVAISETLDFRIRGKYASKDNAEIACSFSGYKIDPSKLP